MRVTVKAVIICALGTLSKRLEELEIGRTDIVQITALSRSARILEICSPSDSSERPSTDAGVKNSQRVEKQY